MFISLDQALLQEPKEVKFVVLGDKVIGRKLRNELFLEFEVDVELAKQIKEALKAYEPVVLPDNEKQGRVMLLTKTGQLVRFNYEYLYYEGIVKPVFFSRLYTSDVLNIRGASLLARYDLQTAQKKYIEAITEGLK